MKGNQFLTQKWKHNHCRSNGQQSSTNQSFTIWTIMLETKNTRDKKTYQQFNWVHRNGSWRLNHWQKYPLSWLIPSRTLERSYKCHMIMTKTRQYFQSLDTISTATRTFHPWHTIIQQKELFSIVVYKSFDNSSTQIKRDWSLLTAGKFFKLSRKNMKFKSKSY